MELFNRIRNRKKKKKKKKSNILSDVLYKFSPTPYVQLCIKSLLFQSMQKGMKDF